MADPNCKACGGTGVSEGAHGRTASCSCNVRTIEVPQDYGLLTLKALERIEDLLSRILTRLNALR